MSRIAIVLVACVVVAGGALFTFLSDRKTPDDIFLDLPPPAAADAAAIPDIEVSTISLPIVLPHETLMRWGDSKAPQNINGQAPLGEFGPTKENSAAWDLLRGPFSYAAQDGKLIIRSSIGGDVRVQGKIEPLGGKLGNLLGGLKPSKSYSQAVDVRVAVDTEFRPQLSPDWKINPELIASAYVEDATASIAGIFDLPLKDLLQPQLTKIVKETERQIAGTIAENRALEAAAQQAWQALCEPIAISAGGGVPSLSLRITPLAFFAAQPEIEAEASRLNLGLDAILRVVPETEPVDPCPAFNNILSLTDRPHGRTSISVDAEIDYGTLNAVLETLRADAPSRESATSALTLEDVKLSPFGSKILVAAKGAFSAPQMLGAKINGTVYLSANPAISEDGTKLRLFDAKLHEASRLELAKFSVPVVEAIEPFINDKLSKLEVDLAPQIANATRVANEAAAGLTNMPGPLRFSGASVDSVSARNLWHDVNGIYVRLSAEGSMSAEIPLPQ